MVYNHKKSGQTHSTLNDMRRDLEQMRSIIYYRERSDKAITDNYVYAYKNRAAYDMGDYCGYYRVSFDKNNEAHFHKIK